MRTFLVAAAFALAGCAAPQPREAPRWTSLVAEDAPGRPVRPGDAYVEVAFMETRASGLDGTHIAAVGSLSKAFIASLVDRTRDVRLLQTPSLYVHLDESANIFVGERLPAPGGPAEVRGRLRRRRARPRGGTERLPHPGLRARPARPLGRNPGPLRRGRRQVSAAGVGALPGRDSEQGPRGTRLARGAARPRHDGDGPARLSSGVGKAEASAGHADAVAFTHPRRRFPPRPGEPRRVRFPDSLARNAFARSARRALLHPLPWVAG